MGLQVRVRHALGERLVELPDRTVENPIIVGRAAGSEVQVPSVSVAPKHCALFRHEGHWVVQDIGGTTGTYVNGEPVEQATLLQIGDVITVGTESAAPVIEVDPAGVAEGRTGYAGDELPADPGAAYAQQAVPGSYAATGYPAAGYPAAGGYAAPSRSAGYAAPSAAGWGGQAADNGNGFDAAGWQADPSAAPIRPRSYKKKKPDNSAAILICVVAAVVIVGGTAWYVVEHSKPQVVVEAAPAPKKGRASDDEATGNNIFGIGGSGGSKGTRVTSSGAPSRTGSAKPRPAPRPKIDPDNDIIANGPAPSADEPAPAKPAAGGPKKTDAGSSATPPANKPDATETPAPDKTERMDPVPTAKPPAGDSTEKPEKPEKMDASNGDKPDAGTTAAKPPGTGDAWDEMEQLSLSPKDPAVAIYRFDDFKRSHAGQHDQEIAEFIDKKFDHIWWERIAQLFKKRDDFGPAITKKQHEIFDENIPEEKKKELADLAKMKKDLEHTTEILRNTMGYDLDSAPDPANKTQLAELREKRDQPKYETWKRITYKYILDNHGKLPWDGE